MSLLAVGLSYRTAPVALLERASVGPDELPKTLHELLRGGHVSEALVLSTCNRVEVYADVDRFHGGVHDVTSVLARRAGVEVPELGEHLYVQYEDAAVLHLFSVAAGLDSMVVGESQILGQLRSAYSAATELDSVGRGLHDLCQQALRVGKRAHSETGIDRAGASVVSVAIGAVERVVGPLAGRRAVVVGAGSMGALTAATLGRAGLRDLVLVNRTPERADRLAATVRSGSGLGASGGQTNVRTAGLEDLVAQLRQADLAVACTGAIGQVIGFELVEAALVGRPGRPLVLLDLALPRDVDPAVSSLPGVHYVDLESLREVAGRAELADEVARARELVTAEVAGYLAGQRATAVAPTVAALRARAAEVVEAELGRLDSRLPGLDPELRAEVAHAVHRAVQTLLHAPTVRIKQLAEQPGGDAYAAALRELFGLDPAAPAAVTSVTTGGLSAAGPTSPEEVW